MHGYVGNKSAVFPMQTLGLEVDFINSVQVLWVCVRCCCRLGQISVITHRQLASAEICMCVCVCVCVCVYVCCVCTRVRARRALHKWARARMPVLNRGWITKHARHVLYACGAQHAPPRRTLPPRHRPPTNTCSLTSCTPENSSVFQSYGLPDVYGTCLSLSLPERCSSCSVCVSVRVRVRERARALQLMFRVCVCMCVRASERERCSSCSVCESESEGGRESVAAHVPCCE